MRVVAVLNQKGGVGKTTTAVNLGAALALRENEVLLIDLDPQGNLTDHLGLEVGGDEAEGEERLTAYDLLMGEATLKDVILPTGTPHLSVVPSHQDLSAVELELAGVPGRETRLKDALAKLSPKAYDWVLIDCPPSLGLLSLNAMAAAREVFITLQTEYFALRGLGQLDKIVSLVREQVNPDLVISGIVATLVDPVTNLAREVVDEVKNVYGHRVFATRIRKNVRLAEAPGHQTHIFAYAPTSTGAADYHALADEVDDWDPATGAVAGNTAPKKKVSIPVAIPVEAPERQTAKGRPGAQSPAAPQGASKPQGAATTKGAASAKGAEIPKGAGRANDPLPPAAKERLPAPTKTPPAPMPTKAVATPPPKAAPPGPPRASGGTFAPRVPPAAATPAKPLPPKAPAAAPAAKSALPDAAIKPAAPAAKPPPAPAAKAAAPATKTAAPGTTPKAAPTKTATPAEPARPAVPSPGLRHQRPWMKPAGK